MKSLTSIVQSNSLEDNRFKSISDFKDCMVRGGEVEFTWGNKPYSITHPDGKMSICQGDHYSEALDAETVDELLDYLMDGVPLRDIITKVTVVARTIL